MIKSARPIYGGPLSLRFAPVGSDPSSLTLFFAIPKRTGNAVVRNRIRRRMRAAARECDLTPGLYLWGARAEAVKIGFSELKSTMQSVANKASAK